MMARNQIALEPELQRRARRKALDQGVSFSEYVRRLVARDLEEKSPGADISLAFNLGSSRGPTSIRRHKDAMIAESLESKLTRRTKR